MSVAGNISPADRLGLTLFVAVVLHAMLILGIGFDFEPPKDAPPVNRTLEILVVRNPVKAEQPKQADFLAQVSQQGGGQEQTKERPTTRIAPPAARLADQPAPEVLPTPTQSQPEPVPPKEVLTQPSPAPRKIQIAEQKKPAPVTRKKVTAAQLLASSSREIDRLTAELERKNRARARWQRHKQVTASTREFKYATYLDAWVKKVERIGNLNYPDEAKRRKLYGNLILHVALLPDGSVKEINVRKSSGHKLLDDAAIRIVQLSSPFAEFPPDIREETDIIDIIRTWQFRNNNQLSSR